MELSHMLFGRIAKGIGKGDGMRTAPTKEVAREYLLPLQGGLWAGSHLGYESNALDAIYLATLLDYNPLYADHDDIGRLRHEEDKASLYLCQFVSSAYYVGWKLSGDVDKVKTNDYGVWPIPVEQAEEEEAQEDFTLHASLHAGCWYDSHRGYADIAHEVIGDAQQYGWKGGEEDFEVYGADLDALDHDCESAIEYLNTLTPAGYWVGWNDGDFGMYPIDEEGE